jgi:hypothetical protein
VPEPKPRFFVIQCPGYAVPLAGSKQDDGASDQLSDLAAVRNQGADESEAAGLDAGGLRTGLIATRKALARTPRNHRNCGLRSQLEAIFERDLARIRDDP